MAETFFQVSIPYRLQSWANGAQGRHWAVKAARVKREHGMVNMALKCGQSERMANLPTLVRLWGIKIEIHFVRIAPRELDSDNLASAFKAIRDAVAKFIGVSDAPSGGINWTYAQEKSKDYAVRIEFFRETS